MYLPVLEARSPGSRSQQGWLPLIAMMEGSVPCLLLFLKKLISYLKIYNRDDSIFSDENPLLPAVSAGVPELFRHNGVSGMFFHAYVSCQV